jgi:hypothetical protein
VQSIQRLSFSRFTEAIVERGLIQRDMLAQLQEQASGNGGLLTELIVTQNLVSDWELSSFVCDLFNLPFLTVDCYPPANGITDGFDADYLREHALVPLDFFGDVLTVAMPGMIAPEVLDGMIADKEIKIMAVVGSVSSNRAWLGQYLPAPEAEVDEAAADLVPASPDALPALDGTLEIPLINLDDIGSALPNEVDEGEWADLFEAGDQAVQRDLED